MTINGRNFGPLGTAVTAVYTTGTEFTSAVDASLGAATVVPSVVLSGVFKLPVVHRFCCCMDMWNSLHLPVCHGVFPLCLRWQVAMLRCMVKTAVLWSFLAHRVSSLFHTSL